MGGEPGEFTEIKNPNFKPAAEKTHETDAEELEEYKKFEALEEPDDFTEIKNPNVKNVKKE